MPKLEELEDENRRLRSELMEIRKRHTKVLETVKTPLRSNVTSVLGYVRLIKRRPPIEKELLDQILTTMDGDLKEVIEAICDILSDAKP